MREFFFYSIVLYILSAVFAIITILTYLDSKFWSQDTLICAVAMVACFIHGRMAWGFYLLAKSANEAVERLKEMDE